MIESHAKHRNRNPEVNTMQLDQKTSKAVSNKGEKIFEETIKPQIDLEQERGKFVVIDVETGDYEIDKRDAVATRRLIERRPKAFTYAIRVGFPTAYKMVGMKTRNLSSDNR